MFRRTLGISLTCALGASAFLLPPGFAPSHNPSTLRLASASPKAATVTLPCSECAFPYTQDKIDEASSSEDDWLWIQGGANELLLKFTVSNDGQSLELDGNTIYPQPRRSFNPFSSSISVTQAPAGASPMDIDSGDIRSTSLEVTGATLHASNKHAITSSDDAVITLTYHIQAVAHKQVSLDEVVLTLLSTGDGELLIMDAQRRPDHSVPLELSSPMIERPLPSAGNGQTEIKVYEAQLFQPCKNLPATLCRLKQTIENKIMNVRGGKCRGPKGMRHGGVSPFGFETSESSRHHHGRPHHMRPHGQHRGGHRGHHGRHGHLRHQSFMHFFAKGLVAVLIPIMAGILVGMTVSFFGLLIGRLVSFIWTKLTRGWEGYRLVTLEEAIRIEEERTRLEESGYVYMPVEEAMRIEKERLAAGGTPGVFIYPEGEAPPQYEDAPAYTDEK